MTTHELAAKLLEGPNVKVVIAGHEPNDDTFDEITEIKESCAWQFDLIGKGFGEQLDRDPPRNPNVRRRDIAVVELR